MDSKLIALLATVSLALVAFNQAETRVEQFETYKVQYGKSYGEDEAYRFAVYNMNLAKIAEHNAKGLSWTMGVNQFTDMTQEEFEAVILMNNLPEQPEASEIYYSAEAPVGDVNWVTQGKVSAVKDQGSCGSCWAFSVQSTLESQAAIFTGRLPRLSEQQLVDCDRASGNMGCSGGWPSAAIDYLSGSGICTSATYAYEARNGNCRESSCSKDSYTTGRHTAIARGSTSSLQSAANGRPISVCVNASPWSGYSGGILTGCSAGTNHAVLLAGYTSSYWLLKNSWGSFWGESGYIRVGPGNECGLANVAVYSQ